MCAILYTQKKDFSSGKNLKIYHFVANVQNFVCNLYTPATIVTLGLGQPKAGRELPLGLWGTLEFLKDEIWEIDYSKKHSVLSFF